MNDNHYNQISFIKRGPILHLEQEYGDDSVLVLDCSELSIGSKGEIDNINVPAFMESVVPIVKNRLSKRHFYNALNVNISGHRILVLVGLCQEYGALTITEIKSYFCVLNIDHSKINNYIYCAELFGWIAIVRKGNHIFYVAKIDHPFLSYSIRTGVSPRETLRWRTNIRTHWRINDRPRSNAIRDVMTAVLTP